MKIALLSDTHGYWNESLIPYFSGHDEIWHAGDIGNLAVTDALAQLAPLRAVYGNIDGPDIRAHFPEHDRFERENLKIWLTHIGGYPGRYAPRLRSLIQRDPPDLFVCGHSHILKVMRDQKLSLLHLNPGALGKHGFHKVRTFLRFSLQQGRLENLEVVEFPR